MKLKRLLAAMLCLTLLVIPSGQALLEGDEDGTGGGGGDKTPTLDSITIKSVTETTATVWFKFSNNIGYEAESNRGKFSLSGPSGSVSSFTMVFESSNTSDMRRVAVMNITGLTPGTTYTASVSAGVAAKNGNSTPSGGSKSFTTKAEAKPQPTTQPTPKAEAKPQSTTQPTPQATSQPNTPKPSSNNNAGNSSSNQGSGAASQTPGQGSSGSSANDAHDTQAKDSTPKPSSSPTPADSSPATATPIASQETTPSASDVNEELPAWADGMTEDTTIFQTDTPGSGGGTGGGKAYPLELVKSMPVEGEKEVAVNSVINLEFSKNVIYLQVRDNNKASITLWEGENAETQVEAEIIMADDQIDFEARHDIQVKPLSPLKEGSKYTVKIADTMVAKSGSLMTGPLEIVFYTVGYGRSSNTTALLVILGVIVVGVAIYIIKLRGKKVSVDE